ncbi:cytochrome P450 [Phascolomyces articulosus]|uniref:Cytochrome P450 n=1 Tax=Phascolomyces articulosus TaxID=60185 RepID=A0AAD5JRM2_9FUNG|nr:cytochrome P450 [Phascolomyces articulosus]
MIISSSIALLDNKIKEQFWSLCLRAFGKTPNSFPPKKITISIAVAVVSIYAAFRKLTQPPPQLRNLPRPGFLQYVSTILMNKPYDNVLKEVIYPVAFKADHGLYAAFGLFGWSVYITDSVAARKLLTKTDLFPKINIINSQHQHTLFGRFAVGPNIIFLPHGPQWKAQRSVMNPAFNRSMPVRLFGELTQKLFVQLDKTADSSPIDVLDIMNRWTLDAIGIAGFDFDFDAITNKNSEWVTRYHHIMGGSRDALYQLLPFLESPRLRALFPKRNQIHHELDLFLEKMQEIIAHKREILNNNEFATNKKTNEKDLLTLMLEAAKEENGKLTDEEIMANLCGFFLAGHDTTSNAISYALYNLATHPDIQEKARDEANRILGSEPIDVLPTVEQINEMTYTQMIIKETMRVNTIVQNIVSRKVVEDVDIGGFVVPKGAQVTLDIMAIHRNPKIWKNPDEFNPERFEPGGEAEKVTKMGLGWVPFSNGARQCIGKNFSLTEQRVIIPMLLRKYELSLPDDSIHKDKVVISGIGSFSAVNLQIKLKKRY